MLKLDYYKILGVAKVASQEEIKKAYREAVKKYHPDLHKDEPSAHKKMAEVNEAYETLGDPAKRGLYDKQEGATNYVNFTPPVQNSRQPRWGFGEEDFVKEAFESYLRGADKAKTKPQAPTAYSSYFDNFVAEARPTKKEAAQGKDLTKKLTLTETEARLGTKKEVKVKRYDKCGTCRGRGTVWGYDGAKKCPSCHGTGVTKNARNLIITLPGGLRTGMRVHVAGQGDAGKQGRKDGALYLLITVKVKIQKKEQDERLTVVLAKIKALEKTYKKLARKFTSKTFLKNTTKFIGSEWLGLGKLYGEYAAGKLEQEIKTLKAKGQALKQVAPEQLEAKLKTLATEVTGKTEEFQTGLAALEKVEKIKLEKKQA